ncbi:MAG TPA: histidine phosphatase family protein [Steroidobacteraceae bacterium]|nr:histidine phosphatase family protein [Steroidobacteraceae bacterium]
MEFVLIRHTRCAVASGTCYGRLDVPLAHSAADDIAHTLDQTPHVDIVFSSPAQRCLQLANALASRDRCELHVMPELQELDFGAWEGLRWDEISRSESDPWAEDPWNRAPPAGETESELWVRVQALAERLHQITRVRRIAVIGHGGPLRALRCILTRTAIDERWSLNMGCGEVVRIA